MQPTTHTFYTLSLRAAFAAVMAMTVFSFAANAQTPALYSGSDTVHSVVESALSAFVRNRVGYKPQLKDSGTSQGLKEFCGGRAILAGASRLIKAEESKACAAAGVQFIELPVALDAVALVVSTQNTWLKSLTLAELSKAFDPASAGKVSSWSQIRPGFPDSPLKTAGVGIKHATFGFFSDSLGLLGFIRTDYKDFPSHTETAKYVAGEAAAIGFISMGEATAMEGRVRMIGIDFGSGAVVPVANEMSAGKYDKLSRTIYLYVNTAALAKAAPDDIAFTQMLVNEMDKYVSAVNLTPLRSIQYQENVKRLAGSAK